MKLSLNPEGNKRAIPDDDDQWAIIVFGTGPDGNRVTVVGPYEKGLARPQDDREVWRQEGQRAVMVRMMHPADFEKAVKAGDLTQFGFAARIDDEAQTTEWGALKKREKKMRESDNSA